MAADTARVQLGWFVDAAVEVLDDADLRTTPMTRMNWEGLDRDLCDRVLWDLQDESPEEVARNLGLELSFVQSVSRALA